MLNFVRLAFLETIVSHNCTYQCFNFHLTWNFKAFFSALSVNVWMVYCCCSKMQVFVEMGEQTNI